MLSADNGEFWCGGYYQERHPGAISWNDQYSEAAAKLQIDDGSGTFQTIWEGKPKDLSNSEEINLTFNLSPQALKDNHDMVTLRFVSPTAYTMSKDYLAVIPPTTVDWLDDHHFQLIFTTQVSLHTGTIDGIGLNWVASKRIDNYYHMRDNPTSGWSSPSNQSVLTIQQIDLHRAFYTGPDGISFQAISD